MNATAPIRRNDPCPCGSARRYKECHGRLDEASPGIETLAWRALTLHRQGSVDDAERLYRAILSQEPANAVATHYLGMAAWQRGEAREGERLMRESLRANPSIPDFHNNLGLLLKDTGRASEAIASYGKALEVDPGWYEAHNNRGLALEDLGRFDEALEAYRAGIAREPRFAAARQNLGRLLVALGRYAQGWEEYRWRLLAQGVTANAPDPGATRLPASLAGRRIELQTEQGLGDVLFFLRFAPELVQRGAVLAFRGDARLHRMLALTGLFAAGLLAERDPNPASEALFIGDLPWLLEANDSAKFPPPLALEPITERVETLRARLEKLGPRPRIALTWRAGVASKGPSRSQVKEIAPEKLGGALRGIQATWISVQRFPRAGEREILAQSLGAPVHDFSPANEDLEEMLALLSLIDEYVGASNANTHLRAGLKGSMQVLIPFPPEWRWGVEGERSPCFAGMRLHRQSRDGDWDAALESLRAALTAT